MHTVNGISENGSVHASQQGCAHGSARADGQVLHIPERWAPSSSAPWNVETWAARNRAGAARLIQLHQLLINIR